MSTKPTNRLFGLTKSQIDILVRIAKRGPHDRDNTVPYGIYRSLVIKGLIARAQSGRYYLTKDGVIAASGLRVLPP